MSKLISFIIPSRYPKNVQAFFDNIQETAHHPQQIEVLVKFDDDQTDTISWLKRQQEIRPFTIKFINTPRIEGFYSGAIAVEQLFYMTDPDSYFIHIMSDEPRFLTKGWDDILRSYQHFFKDDIFRLRLSSFKYKNYSSHYECTFQPDSFPIYTRRWLELTEGTGDCWGSDGYQQCVAFHLALGPKSYFNYFREFTYHRDVVVPNIDMAGLEFAAGVATSIKLEREKRNFAEWNRLTSHPMQEHFSYLARRLYCAIVAAEYRLTEFQLIKNEHHKTVVMVDKYGTEFLEVSYAVPRLVVYTQNLARRLYTTPRLLASRWLKQIKHSQKKSVQNHVALSEPTPEHLHMEYHSPRKKLRRSLRRLISPYYQLTNFIDQQFLTKKRPGISVLYSKRPQLQQGVKPPTSAQVMWLREELNNQQTAQKKLRDKLFK